MEVNGNHAVARFVRAWLFLNDPDTYEVCGEITITPFFVFARGHYGPSGDYGVCTGIAYPCSLVRHITDQSVEPCETHDDMDAEAKALMESADDAQEDTEN